MPTTLSQEQQEDSFLFTSESVLEGHPDKMCDLVSDAVLDAHLKQDSHAKVACEAVCKTGMMMLCGEISSTAAVNYSDVVRDTLKEIGYDSSAKGMDYRSCNVMVAVEEQAEEIAIGVHQGRSDDDVGAGDQGAMFGYATDETPECMPLTCVLSHALARKLAELRRNGTLPWLYPDGKVQVTIEYKYQDGATIPQRVHTVVVSTQHSIDTPIEKVRAEVLEKVVKTVIPEEYLDAETLYYMNPAGRFIQGGAKGDTGLTGRKIMVDTYGGWGSHGGGSFSGKDFTKVDRSGAYAARWIAKSLVKAGLCRRVLVQISYAIAITEPLSISIFHYGSSSRKQSELLKIVKENFDLRPGAIIKELDLRKPIYHKTACYGHFGREEFSWEKPKKLEY